MIRIGSFDASAGDGFRSHTLTALFVSDVAVVDAVAVGVVVVVAVVVAPTVVVVVDGTAVVVEVGVIEGAFGPDVGDGSSGSNDGVGVLISAVAPPPAGGAGEAIVGTALPTLKGAMIGDTCPVMSLMTTR